MLVPTRFDCPLPSAVSSCLSAGRSVSCRLSTVAWSRTICIARPRTPCWDTPSSKIWLMRDKFASCSKTTWTEPGRRGRKVRGTGCSRFTVNRPGTPEGDEDWMHSASVVAVLFSLGPNPELGPDFSFFFLFFSLGFPEFFSNFSLTHWNWFQRVSYSSVPVFTAGLFRSQAHAGWFTAVMMILAKFSMSLEPSLRGAF